MTQALTRSDLEQIYTGAPLVRKAGQPVNGDMSGVEPVMIGLGLFEVDLTQAGVPKRELKELTARGLLMKVMTTYKGGWRNTYVLPFNEVKT